MISACSLSSVTLANVGPYSVVIRARTSARVNLWKSARDGQNVGGFWVITAQPKLPRLRERDEETRREERKSFINDRVTRCSKC